jgi:hypothetical protein
MKNRTYFWIMTILAVGTLWFLFHKSPVITPHQQEAAASMATTVINSPNPQVATNADSNATSNAANVAVKDAQGLTGKEVTMQQVFLEGNKTSQDIYGRVIDQNGAPITEADVKGNLILNDGTYGGYNVKKYSAKTDGNGLFEFVDLHGADLNVLISKDGYKIGDRGEGRIAPVGSRSSPADRAIFIIWKLRGAEPLISSGIDAHIPHDGTPVVFDMTSGKQSPGGDFRVTLSQYPLEVKRGWDRFDWSVKVEILNGGMLEESDAYPYLAPADGYQPIFEFSESTNAVKWLGGLQKKFYIKTAQGQYGIMQFQVFPGRSPTGFQANFTINPSGSQNLELQQPK